MKRPSRLAAASLLALVVTAACGKKGAPLPPLRPVPAAPTEVTARRVSERVYLRFVVPAANQDPASPLSLSRIDIYARSLAYGSVAPVISQLVHRDFLVGSIEVRPAPAADAPPPDPAAPADPRPAPGEAVTWSESLAGLDVRPLAMTRAQRDASQARRAFPLRLPPTSLAVPFTPIILPTRYYVVVGVSAQGRNGGPSLALPVRLGGAPPPPADPALAYDAETLTLSWTTAPRARVVVYESTPAGVEAAAPVQAAPITTGTWSTPVTFGVERCFTIRQVHVDGPVSTESTPAGPVCVTPADTFPPPAPADAVGVAETGRVVLQWSPVTIADLAGYRILRGEGPGATLQPLNPVLEQTTGYADLTARAGVEYTYVVVAVDTAGNQSAPSAQVRVTGR